MFEIIKILIENVFGLVSKLPAARRGKKLGKIGADLYLLYMAANHVVFNGEEIVEALEGAVRTESDANVSIGYILRRKGGWEYGFVGEWMERQSEALVELGYRIWRLSETFQIVDPESCNKLMRLLGGKANALDSLVIALKQQRIPTGDLQPEAIEQLFRLSITFDAEERRGLIDPVVSQFLPVAEPWSPSVRRIIQEYLDVGRPRAQLAEIRGVLEEFRKTLIDTFSTEEILLHAGGRQIHREEYWGYRWWEMEQN